jgi:hypothetical protein
MNGRTAAASQSFQCQRGWIVLSGPGKGSWKIGIGAVAPLPGKKPPEKSPLGMKTALTWKNI